MKNNTFIYKSSSPNDTKEFASLLVKKLKAGDVVTLGGDLGAGKTTFVSGALKAFGYEGKVISPTFNILKCYNELTPPIYHIDAYRLENIDQDLGLEEFIEDVGISFIEWPQFIKKIIPLKHLEIEIELISDNQRKITVKDPNRFYEDILRMLEA